MRDTGRKWIASVGAVLMVSGAALLVTAGAAQAQAATHPTHRATKATAPTGLVCGSQYGRNDPTNSSAKVLDSYFFAIEHNGVTTNVCSLFPNVRAGDIVTAFFTLHTGASAGTRLSLVSYTANDENKDQTLFECASFGVSTGSCVSSTSDALTVHVPACGFQVDLIYGAPETLHTEGAFHANHVWISGQLGDVRSETTCTTPTPSGNLGLTTGGGGGGVLAAVSTPSTGAFSMAQAVLGIVLMTLGASAVVYGGRRLRTEVV